MSEVENFIVENSEGGDLDEHELNQLIGKAWAEAIEDPETRAGIAAEFGLSADQLVGAGSPYRARVTQSGFIGAGVAIFLAGMVAEKLLERVIDRGIDAAEAAAVKVWKRYIRKRVNKPGENNIGRAKVEKD
jgi:hypothetical protein